MPQTYKWTDGMDGILKELILGAPLCGANKVSAAKLTGSRDNLIATKLTSFANI